MDQNIQCSQGKKPYAQPRITSWKVTLGVYGDYSGGRTVIGYNDPSGGRPSGSGGHRNSGLPELAP